MTLERELQPTYVESKSSRYVTYKIGIFGWHRRCLYFLILLVLVMAIVNLALIIWIIRVQDFGLLRDRIGKLYITNNGIRMDGDAEFLAALKMKEIFSNRPLQINSKRNISLSAVDEHNNVLGQVILSSRKIILKNKELLIGDQHGNTLLHANEDKLTVNIPHMEITVPGGVKFDGDGHLKTSTIQNIGRDLHLESLTRRLNMKSEGTFNLKSHASDMRFRSGNMNLLAKKGKISLNSRNIQLRHLMESTIMGDHLAHMHSGVSEVCMCKDGTLFLAPPEKMLQCKVNDGICV